MIPIPLNFRYNDDNDFIFTVTVTDGGTFTLPFYSGYTYNCKAIWGDGTISTINAYNDAAVTHTYTNAGDYQIRLRGIVQILSFNNGSAKLKIKSVNQWGNIYAISMSNMFYGCTNLTSIPNTPIMWPLVNTCSWLFRGCTSLSTQIPTDLFRYMPLVTSFASAFQSCSTMSGTIPSHLFDYNTLCTNFSSVFSESPFTGSIPTDLFRYNTLVTTFAGAFNTTSISGSIPPNEVFNRSFLL